MTNLILIDSTIPQLEQFTNSINNSSRYIVYNINNTFTDLIQRINDLGVNQYTNLAFVFQGNGLPLKMFVGYNNFIAYDQNGIQANPTTKFIKQLVETYKIKYIDFLACNLLENPTWKNYFEFIIKDNDNNVIVRASDNQTGNLASGGDWILESTGNDVRNLYFTDQIEHWKYLLDFQSTLTAFISNDNLFMSGTDIFGMMGIGTDKTVFQNINKTIGKTIVAVACGYNHTAILTNEATNNLYTCGLNDYGQLGTGNITNSNKFMQINIGKRITSVACGSAHTAILTNEANNNLYTCGLNYYGQLGIGNNTDSNVFVKPNIEKTITSVACGQYHTAILTNESTNNLYTCGDNWSGQLGTGNTTNSNIFVKPINMTDKTVIAIDCGSNHTAILTNESTNNLYTCGDNWLGQLGTGNTTKSNIFVKPINMIDKKVIAISCSFYYTAILTNESVNNIYTCGDNFLGQLGTDNTTNSNIFVKPINMTDKTVIAIACGSAHTAILTNESTNNLYTCGLNDYGQLGTGNTTNSNKFIQTNIGKRITAVACGYSHTAILTNEANNNLYTCGLNYYGELGKFSSYTQVSNIIEDKTIISVVCGYLHTAILTNEATNNLYTCGFNTYGQLGIGSNTDSNIFVQTNIGKTIITVDCGFYYTAILTNESTNNLYTCGFNAFGQLGTGNNADSNVFVKPINMIDKKVTSLSCGSSHTAILTNENNNNLYICGRNIYGELGTYNNVNSNIFVKPNNMTDKLITSVACGRAHTAILTSETKNNLYVCGWNAFGQLGTGDTADSNIFVKPSNMEDNTLTSLGCGYYHTTILTNETTNNLYTCGMNSYGQLGIGSNTDSYIFVKPNNMTNKIIISLGCGIYHTVILTNETNNNLYTCGLNADGQLVNGNNISSNIFVQSVFTDKVTYINGTINYRFSPGLGSSNITNPDNSIIYYYTVQDWQQNTLTTNTNINGNTTTITFGPPRAIFTDYIKYELNINNLSSISYLSSTFNSQPQLLNTTAGGDAYYEYVGTTLTIYIRHFSDIIIETNNQTNNQVICFHPDSQLLIQRNNILQWITISYLQKGDILIDNVGSKLNVVKLHITKKTNKFVQISNNMWITPAHLLKKLENGQVSHACKFTLPIVEKECNNTYHIETDGNKAYHFIPVQPDIDEISSEFAVEVWGKRHTLSNQHMV